MKLSVATSYALQSLIRLAHLEKCVPTSTNRLASGNIPRRFLAQILHKLVEHNVLISTTGAMGGYYLARSPRTITLLEIIEAVEGTFAITMAGVPGLSTHAQNELTSKLVDSSKYVRARLETLTLAHLAALAPDVSEELAQNGDIRSETNNFDQITTLQLEAVSKRLAHKHDEC